MKNVQGPFISGYVTVKVKGKKPELFFQDCINQGIQVWDIRSISDEECLGNVLLRDITQVRKAQRRRHYKIKFIDKKGYPFLISRFLRKRELVIGLVVSILLIVFLSNIIWKVEIAGVPKDIEEKIDKQLKSYGVHPGAFIFTLDKPGRIQQKLTEDIPELLWVGVNQKGTTFYLEGVEKIIVKEEEVEGPRDLVATKKGVISKMYVSKGRPLVQVHDYVEPGDVLVSGKLNEYDNQEENDEEEKKESSQKNPILVAAEGEIIAKTWYEVSVTIPLKKNYELVTGKHEKKYYIGIGGFQLPIWGFGDPDFTTIHRENVNHSLNFFQWELPITVIESTLSEKNVHEIERTKEEAIQSGIKQAKQELQLQIGSEANIISEKVLHESEENGKVKLELYLTVEENIAKAQPINQGD